MPSAPTSRSNPTTSPSYRCPDTPIQIGADVQTDPARTVVQLVDRPTVGLVVPITALVAPSATGIEGASLGILAVDEISASFTEVANNLGGDGTVVERLEAIEATMRDDFSLDPGAPGGGMQLALIQRFLTETRRGNAEQFATAFVLLARSLGVNARVATGFVVPPDELDDRIELRSDLARTWPEVEVIGRGMGRLRSRARAGSGRAPRSRWRHRRRRRPPPSSHPSRPPESTNNDDVEPPPDADASDAGGWSTVTRWVVRSAFGLAIVLVPVFFVTSTIVARKVRRRRRRLAIADERQRVRAMWAVATDALVDAGLTIAPAWTDRQIATTGRTAGRGGTARAGPARRDVERRDVRPGPPPRSDGGRRARRTRAHRSTRSGRRGRAGSASAGT